MAKAPRPGKVKTRLSPPLTPDQASALNICFIRDTTENIQQVTEASNSAGLVAYTPVGDESAFDGLLPSGFQLLSTARRRFWRAPSLCLRGSIRLRVQRRVPDRF